MDVAVSFGTTTLEWIEALHKAGIDRDMTAGDSFIIGFYWLHSFKWQESHVLADKSGHPLECEVFETLPTPASGQPRPSEEPGTVAALLRVFKSAVWRKAQTAQFKYSRACVSAGHSSQSKTQTAVEYPLDRR